MPNWPIINCFGVTVARVDNEHRTVTRDEENGVVYRKLKKDGA